MTRVIIYARPGCHLCEEMKSLVERVGLSIPIAVQEIDISGDEQLESLYGLEIPVLMVEGKKAAKYRVTEGDLRRLLMDRAG
jgi:glutaredoxin